MEAQLPSLKRGQGPQFSAHFHCGQTARCIKMPVGMEVGLSPGDFVFDGDPANPIKRHTHPTQILVHVYCGQTAGIMKSPLGTEVDIGPGHIVLHVFPAIREKGTAAPPPSFRPMSIVATDAHLSYRTAELFFVVCCGSCIQSGIICVAG